MLVKILRKNSERRKDKLIFILSVTLKKASGGNKVQQKSP